MKRILVAAAFLAIALPAWAQPVTISGLPSASTPLAGTEVAPIVQGGVTKKAPASAFGNLPTVPFTGLSFSFMGATSGAALVIPQAIAGTPTLTLPNASGTFAVSVSAPLALSATTGNLTITGAAGQVLAGATPAFTATPTLGASGTLGSLTFGNATSGLLTLQPGTGALGTVTASLPANSGTIAELNLAQSWTATQTVQTLLAGTTNTYDIGTSATVAAFRTVYAGTSFIGPVGTFTTSVTTPVVNLSGTSNQIVFQSAGVTGTLSWSPATTNKTITLPNGTTDFTGTGGTGQVLRQSTTGAAITVATMACSDLSNGATGCSTATGTSGAKIPILNAANTWSAVQTFTNSDIALLGSSTGKTTFTSANSGASNFTLTFPATTATVTATIASGSSALNTSLIASTACNTTTISATGTLTTDVVAASFNGSPAAVTGYAPLTTGGLSIRPYPTVDNVNFEVCNGTTSSITPGAITLNWGVRR